MAEEVEGERSRGRVSSAASASEGFLPLNDPPVIHFSRRSLARFYEAKYGKIALCARCVLLCSFAQSFFPLFLRSLVLTEATANIENSIRYIFPNCCLCVKRKDCLSVFLPFDLHHSLFGLSCIFVKFVSSDINPIGTFSSIRATCEVSAYGREKNSSQRVKDTILPSRLSNLYFVIEGIRDVCQKFSKILKSSHVATVQQRDNATGFPPLVRNFYSEISFYRTRLVYSYKYIGEKKYEKKKRKQIKSNL